MTSGSAKLSLFLNSQVVNLLLAFQILVTFCTKILLATQAWWLYPQRARPDNEWSPLQRFPKVCCGLTCGSWHDMLSFWRNAHWCGTMICDMNLTNAILPKKEKGRGMEGICSFTLTTSVWLYLFVNTEALCVKVCVRDNGTWTYDGSWAGSGSNTGALLLAQ